MQTDVTDLRPTIVPKSDQLNSEQLLGAPMVITVTDVRAGGSDEQPVTIHYENDQGRPYKPCKTMRKVLILAWGANGLGWIGKSMQLYNDPAVKFGGADVGGIRISHLTDIPKDIHVQLTATKGKKAPHAIKRMEPPAGTGGPTLEEVIEAIHAAKNKATMDAAKALALQLRTDDEIGVALDAYKARVAELKAGAAPPPPAADSFVDDMNAAENNRAGS